MGRKKNGKDISCENCGKIRYFFGKKLRRQKHFYCCRKCADKGKIPWNKGLTKDMDKRLKIVSEKSREQLKREYSTGIRDRFEITRKANEHVRKFGQPKLKGNPSWIKGKTKETNESVRRISDSKKGEKNPRFGKKPWNRLSPTKKWWEEKEFKRLRKLCFERDNYRCVKCRKREKDMYCDHKIPYRICREHKLENLQTLCGSDHSKKTAEDVKKYGLKDF